MVIESQQYPLEKWQRKTPETVATLTASAPQRTWRADDSYKGVGCLFLFYSSRILIFSPFLCLLNIAVDI